MPIHVCPPYYSSLMWSCRTPRPSCLLSAGHLAATQPHDALSPWQQHHGAGRGGQAFKAPQAYHSLPPREPHGGHQGLLPVRPLQGSPAQDPGLYWGEYGRHGHSHHSEHHDSTKDKVQEEEEAKRHLTCAMHCVSMLYALTTFITFHHLHIMVRLQNCKMWWRQGQWRGTYANPLTMCVLYYPLSLLPFNRSFSIQYANIFLCSCH